MAAGGHGSKAVIAALLANLGIAIAKFVGFAITGSASMLAESIHSVADSGNQGLLLLGGKRARRAADHEHPFGYAGAAGDIDDKLIRIGAEVQDALEGDAELVKTLEGLAGADHHAAVALR